MSPQAELNYKGHYRYPNMCHCTKYSTVSSDQWKIFISPSLHLVFNFLNSDKKWIYAVYNCTCIHKLVAIVRHNLAIHRLVTPFITQQPIHRPHLLERVYKPMCTPH